MTEMELCEAVKAFVVEQMSQISWEAKDGSMEQSEPKGIIGFYPPKRSNEEEDFPFVLVMPQSGSTTDAQTQSSTLAIYIGARSESFEGYRYLFSAVENIRHELLRRPGNIICHNGHTFQMQFPFTWEYPDEQQYPFWFIKITTQWAMPVVQQEDPEGYLS